MGEEGHSCYGIGCASTDQTFKTPSTLPFALITWARVVETSVTNNSSFQS